MFWILENAFVTLLFINSLTLLLNVRFYYISVEDSTKIKCMFYFVVLLGSTCDFYSSNINILYHNTP